MDNRSRRVEYRTAPRRLGLSALAIIALVGVTACGSAAPAATGSSRPISPVGANGPVPVGDWIGFHGDASRSGAALAGPIGNPVVAWQAHAKGAVPGNIAIVGDTVYFASDDGVVHALDRASGADRWTTTLAGATRSGPVAADGRLYFVADSGAPIALDPATGKTLWTGTAEYSDPSQLVSDGGNLYLGTGDGYLIAVDASTGVERWRLQPSPSTQVVHSPAAANGRIFAGTDGGGYVALDAATHQVVWTGDTQGDATGTAAVAGDLAFIGAGGEPSSGHLRAFDATSGERRWTADHPLLQFPTVADGVAYSATAEGLVAAIDTKTGASRWTVQLQGKVRPMAVADTILYLSADDMRQVYALDTATGGKLWTIDVDGSNECCIAVARGSVYVATMTGSVYAIDGDGAAIAAEPLDSVGTSRPSISAPAIADLAVTMSWSTDLRGKGFAPISQIAIDPKGRIWAPEANADTIAILDAGGKLVEEWGSSGNGPGQFDFTRDNGDGYGTLAFAPDGSFFVLDVGNRRVQHFSATRTLLGQWGGFGTGPGEFSDPVGIAAATDGSVWVLDDVRRVVEHDAADGTVLGSFDPFATVPVNHGADSLAIDPQGNLYVTIADPRKVAVFDPTGTFLRFVGDGVFDDYPTDMAIDATGRLFVTQGGNEHAHGVLVFGPDGALIGGFGPQGDGDGQLVFPAGIALDATGGLIVEDSLPESARLIRFMVPTPSP
jgi:outer membrane protein assembly factor BamB